MKDWKTTIIGAFAAILTATAEALQTGQLSPKGIAISCAFALLGYFTKDAETTTNAK